MCLTALEKSRNKEERGVRYAPNSVVIANDESEAVDDEFEELIALPGRIFKGEKPIKCRKI